MKQWAAKVEQLNIRCPECRRIARRVLRDEPLLHGEKAHLEQGVTATLSPWEEGFGMASRRGMPSA